jgi:D-glycero-D-manno-heptose 1,7-bisphosphate phosphatase
MPSIPLRPAVFLDRDGVIIENRDDYVKSVAEVRFLPGALEALTRLARHDYLIVIATNQSAIGRGLLAREAADAVNAHVREQIVAAGGRVDGLYLCPHRPEDNCPCRKPAPGLLLDAAHDLGIDMAASVMIGDSLTDMMAAEAAGVRPLLVLTGLGHRHTAELTPPALNHTLRVPDLAAAVARLLDETPRPTKTPPV